MKLKLKTVFKTIEKEKNRRKIKRLFIKPTKKTNRDCKLLLHDILNILTNPLLKLK
jgi:hypothetical protein